jgi:hypothetical protein
MKTKRIEDLSRGEFIKADLYSRSNAMNGKYKTGQLGLEEFAKIRNSDIFFLEALQKKADLADKMIAETEAKGKDTTDSNIMKELGEEINAFFGTPIHRSESIISAVFESLMLMALYGIAIGIWGFVFKKNILEFVICGVIVGFIISLLFAFMIAFERTKERVRSKQAWIGTMWGPVVIIIGGVASVVLVIRLIFF